MPVEFEKRTIIGVVALLKWGATESFAASAVGVKCPESRDPLAWATKGQCNQMSSIVTGKAVYSTDLGGFRGVFQRDRAAPLQYLQQSR